MTGGVPRGSVLRPLLYINYLDSRINSDLNLFADDIKMDRVIRSESEKKKSLQRDIDRIIRWLMKLNIDTYSENQLDTYAFHDAPLKDGKWRLGVAVSSDLRSWRLSVESRNRAHQVLGFIAKSIKSRSVEVILKLLMALARPHIDYATQFWSPY